LRLVHWEKKLLEEFLGFTTKHVFPNLNQQVLEGRDRDFELFNIEILKVHLVVKAWNWRKNKYLQQDGWPIYMLGNPRFCHIMNHQIVGRNS